MNHLEAEMGYPNDPSYTAHPAGQDPAQPPHETGLQKVEHAAEDAATVALPALEALLSGAAGLPPVLHEALLLLGRGVEALHHRTAGK